MIRVLEACCVSPEQVRTAADNGAGRIELCERLDLGGITPSDENISESVAAGIPVYVLVRPRGGNFVFNSEEEMLMAESIRRCRALGASGVVIGSLLPDGNVDTDMMERLIAVAHGREGERPLGVTFHRAFDRTSDPFVALETIISLGCERILTSGQKPTALEGRVLIAELVKRAGKRIVIMPGSGVTPDNLRIIEQETNAVEFHGTRICSRK